VGFQIHGLHFFSFLLPKGAPLALAPLLVVLELISYTSSSVLSRAIAIGIGESGKTFRVEDLLRPLDRRCFRPLKPQPELTTTQDNHA